MNRFTKRLIAATALLTVSLACNQADAQIPWQQTPETVLGSARKSGKPILVFVTTDWCHYCKKMKRETWKDPRVQQAVAGNFETLVLDGDRDEDVVSKLGLRGFPATLLYTPDGTFIDQRAGYLAPEQTLSWLSEVRVSSP